MQDVNKNKNLSEYRVRDLSIAAYLQTAGATLLSIEPQPGFSFFVFQDNNFCSQLEQRYWSYEKETLSPRQLIETYRNLRTEVLKLGGNHG